MKQRKSSIPTPLSMSPVIFPFSVQFWMIPPTLRPGPWILSPHTVAPRPRGCGQHDVILGALHPIPNRPSLSPEAGNGLPCPLPSWARIGSLVPRCDLQAFHCPGLPHCTLEFDIQPPASSQGSRREDHVWVPRVPGATWCRESLTRWRLGREWMPEEAPRCWGFQLLLEGALPPP